MKQFILMTSLFLSTVLQSDPDNGRDLAQRCIKLINCSTDSDCQIKENLCRDSAEGVYNGLGSFKNYNITCDIVQSDQVFSYGKDGEILDDTSTPE